MNDVSQIDKDLSDYLNPAQPGEASPEHDAWIIAQTEETLAKKRDGKMGYHSLDEVMHQFGHNAR